MKFAVTIASVLTLGLGTLAMADDPAPAAGTAAAPSAVAGDGPVDVCKKIVEAAKKDDFDAVKKLTHGHAGKEKGFHKMHKTYLERLKDLTCVSDLVADNQAVVLAEAAGKKRLVPFVKEASGWQFNAADYMHHYGKHHGKKK